MGKLVALPRSGLQTIIQAPNWNDYESASAGDIRGVYFTEAAIDKKAVTQGCNTKNENEGGGVPVKAMLTHGFENRHQNDTAEHKNR